MSKIMIPLKKLLSFAGMARMVPSSAAGIMLSPLLLFCSCQQENLLEKGVVVVGIESKPSNLDPRIATDAAASRINDLVFSRLFRKDRAGEPVADLVEQWEQTDPTTYRFRIRRGIRFHDGRSLDARDVRYTFQSMMDPSLRSPLRGSYKMISSVECPDHSTVVFNLKEPLASFLVNLDIGILPRPQGEGDAGDPESVLVGSGPYRFLAPGQVTEIGLEAFADYYEGPPRLKEVRFKIVPDNTVRILELKKGTVHLVQNEIEPEVLNILERDPRFTVMKQQGTSYSYFGFNLRDPVLGKKRVRQAIACAIDRESIIKYLLGGLAALGTGVLSPMNWAYEPEVKTWRYDPKEAGRMLDEAGFPDPDGDGPEKRFLISYKTSQNEQRRRIGEAIQSQLNAVGIGVRIRSYEWGTFYSDIQKGNFQTYTLTWVGIADPDIFSYLFDSASVPPEGANRGHYLNPELDRLIAQARIVQDRETRRVLYGKAQKILAEDLPYVSLWYSVNVAVMDRRIKGFELYPDGSLTSLKNAWVERE